MTCADVTTTYDWCDHNDHQWIVGRLITMLMFLSTMMCCWQMKGPLLHYWRWSFRTQGNPRKGSTLIFSDGIISKIKLTIFCIFEGRWKWESPT